MNIFTAKHFNLGGDETLADYEAAEIANTIVEHKLSELRLVNEALNTKLVSVMKELEQAREDNQYLKSFQADQQLRVKMAIDDYNTLLLKNEILIEALSKTKDIAQDMLDADKNNCCSLYSYGDYQYVTDEALAKIEGMK